MSDRPRPLLALSRRTASAVGQVPPFGYGVAFLRMVPLTTRARILTASEAIVGMILVGPFLNSLTSRRKCDGGAS